MHKPLLVSMSSNNNSQHFADLGERFESAEPKINISAVGGYEDQGSGTGHFAFLIDNDTPDQIEAARQIAEDELHFGWREIASRTIELPNQPGELGRAAARLAEQGVNILSILVVGIRGRQALVNFGFDPGTELATVDAAFAAYTILPEDVHAPGQ